MNGCDTTVFYGVGLGPGDPELVTLKALRTLERVAVIMVPSCHEEGCGRAAEVLEAINPSWARKTVALPLPMGGATSAHWKELALMISEHLDAGRCCAYAVEGDPLLYGSYIRLAETLSAVRPHVRIEVINGIPSFAAACGRAGMPLTVGKESLAVMTGPLGVEDMEEAFARFDTLALLKVNGSLEAVREFLHRHEGEVSWLCTQNCTRRDEVICTEDEGLLERDWGYFTLCVIRRRRSHGDGEKVRVEGTGY